MEMRSNVFTRVVDIVAEVAECEVVEIAADTNLPDELEVDSLMGLEILVMVEKEFGVKLEEDQLHLMTTVDNITNLIVAKGYAVGQA